MNRAEITIKSAAGRIQYQQVHTAPSSWKEMRPEHLRTWASVMFAAIDVSLARVILAARLYQVPAKVFKQIKPSEAQLLGHQFDFLFQKNTLHDWLIPKFRWRLRRFYGPKSRLANLTVAEFSLCELCYEQFNNTKNAEYMDTLTAILYRPRRYWGIDTDIRDKLTDHGYIRRAERFKGLPAGLKTAIYLNYEGCRNFLHLKYKEAFTAGSAGSIGQRLAITPWPKIIESAANDIFGHIDQTKGANLHEFLSRLCTRIKDARELEEKTRKR